MYPAEQKTKFNVIVPESVKAKLDKFWRESAFRNRNEFVLQAIENYMAFLENQKLKTDLEKGYRENAKSALKDAEAWESVNFETWPE